MRDPGADGGRQHGCRGDQRETSEVDVAEAAGRQSGVAQTCQNEADRTGQADDKAEQCGRAHGTVNRLIEERQRHDRKRAAADAHHARKAADRGRDGRNPGATRHGIGQVAALRQEYHFQGDEQSKGREHGRQYPAMNLRRNPRAEQRAEQDKHRPPFDHFDIDGTTAIVRPGRRDGRRDDRRKRCRHGDVHSNGRIDTEEAENGLEHWDDDDAATDPEQAGEYASHTACRQHGNDKY